MEYKSKQNIAIKSVEDTGKTGVNKQGNWRLYKVVDENGHKYTGFNVSFHAGDIVTQLDYSEEDAEFVNEKGSTVKYKRRTIVDNAPKFDPKKSFEPVEVAPGKYSAMHDTLKFSINVDELIADHERRIKALEEFMLGSQ